MPSFTQTGLRHLGTITFILCVLTQTLVGLRPLTPYQRSFTPIRNISCAQCVMDPVTETSNKTYVEQEMQRRQCLDEPTRFFKPCPMDGDVAPRGCGKITTFVAHPVSKGDFEEVILVRRFCASEGAEPEELQCVTRTSLGGFSELCICGTDNCNAASRSFGFLGTGLAITALTTNLALLSD
ncbi:hypothetical protein CLF_106949 [Clonorchis sinensis]|uniref:Protein quiver n=1 Tax=Clonorchis sinensis TaxID=79923 RepID=G7YFZ8_CLOSI|nr:hypothetical protein CLF_106949 [Clonorchis sinensis]